MCITYLNTYRDFQIKISRLNTPIVACFYVEWCRQYKKSNKTFRNTFENSEHRDVINVNMLSSIKLIKEYNIISSPTFIAFYNKKVFWRESGVVSIKKFNNLKFVLDNILIASPLHL
jgi:hypothetical protein